MNFLKRLWRWYSDRRTEHRMLKRPGVYRTQTNQCHIPGRKMPLLPISSWWTVGWEALRAYPQPEADTCPWTLPLWEVGQQTPSSPATP
jgi:hypothetical protein